MNNTKKRKKIIGKIGRILGIFIFVFYILSGIYLGIYLYKNPKSFKISSVDILIWLKSDGSALVREERKYNFTGKYTYAYQYFNKKGGRGEKSGRQEVYLLNNFNVCEVKGYHKTCYQKLDQEEINEADKNSKPSTFYFKEKKDSYYLKWFYQAENESKVFLITYEIKNALTLHEDIAEFYWELIGKNWETFQDNISIRIFLPQGIPEDKIQAWAHGPLEGKIMINSPKEVSLNLERINPGQSIKVRILLPKENFWGGAKGELNKEKILAQEEGFVSKTVFYLRIFSLLREVFKITLPFAAAFSFSSLGLFIYKLIMFWRYGKDKKLPEVNLSGRLWEPPSEIEPAQVEQLIRGRKKNTAKSFVATVLSLVSDGFYSLKRSEEKEGLIFRNYQYFLIPNPEDKWRKKPSEIQKKVIDFLKKMEEKIKKEKNYLGIKLSDLKKYSRKYGDYSWNFFQNFQWLVFKKNLKEGLFESKAHRKKKTFSSRIFKIILIFQILWFFLLAIFVSNLDPLEVYLLRIILIGILMNIIFIKLSAILEKFGEKRTEKGREEAARWLAFKKHLEEYFKTVKDPIDSLDLWEKYLIYGTVLGVSKKALSQLPIKFSPPQEDIFTYRWVGGGLTWTPTGYSSNFSSIFTAVDSLESVSRSNFGAFRIGAIGHFFLDFGGGGGSGGGGAG